MAKESAIMVRQECIELVDRSIRRSAHIAGQIFLFRGTSLIHGQARERLTYVGDTMRVGLNKSTRPPLVVGFLPRKKGDTAMTNNVAFMTTIFLFLSIWFFFLSVEFFDSDDYAGCVRGSVCVYTHRPYKRRVRLTDSLFFFFFFGGDPFKLAQKRLFDSRQRKGSTLSVNMYRTLHTQREHRRNGERERSAVCAHLPQFGCSQLTQCASLENDELADTFL